MKHIDFSPFYVLTGKPPPLTDAAAFTSYVTKNNVIGSPPSWWTRCMSPSSSCSSRACGS